MRNNFQENEAKKFAGQTFAPESGLLARQHTSAYVSIRQHTSSYVSIRQHTSAYVSGRTFAPESGLLERLRRRICAKSPPAGTLSVKAAYTSSLRPHTLVA